METSPEHRAALPGLAGGSSWYAKAPLVLLIAAGLFYSASKKFMRYFRGQSADASKVDPEE